MTTSASSVVSETHSSEAPFRHAESSHPATGSVPKFPVNANTTAPGLPDGLQLPDLLKHLSEGVALLDPSLKIRWCSDKFLEQCGRVAAEGLTFQEAFRPTEGRGPSEEFFTAALAGSATERETFQRGDRQTFEVRATPLQTAGDAPNLLMVSVRDISDEVQQQQKLSAIHAAGIELGEISVDDLRELNVQERIELLKEKIIRFTKDVLHFETIEIRLLDKATKRLDPLLNVGMTPEAAARQLFAEKQGNGVTGYVAAGGGSYLCPNAGEDPRYLPGAPNARSSLTVPLILHDEILGTFNVESDRPGAFTDQDLVFLELFAGEVALAINTLELLAVEKVTAATQYTGMILREVARPVDEILNHTTWILDRYIGHDPAVCERLQKVQKHTREIRLLIQKVGAALTPAAPHPSLPPQPLHPRLRSKRILVVDNDDTVRDHAHLALGQIGCEVETAHNGEEALLMARSFHYDVVIVDIRLPDMNGYECFVQLRNINEHLPVILMTGFGYDPGHSIVKARQAGLKSALYKPFRVDQLLSELERAVTTSTETPPRPPSA